MQENQKIIAKNVLLFCCFLAIKGVYMELGKLMAAVEILENQSVSNREMTSQMIRVFLFVAENPAMTQKEMAQILNINGGTISRVVTGLADGSSRKAGLKLIKAALNNTDYRSKQYFLTNKGVELSARIKNI